MGRFPLADDGPQWKSRNIARRRTHRMNETASFRLEDYPLRTFDTVRYGDTDRQGHVNNAAFATFCETGRVTFFFQGSQPLPPPGTSFVIARLILDFRAELAWPGTVDIGTRVT